MLQTKSPKQKSDLFQPEIIVRNVRSSYVAALLTWIMSVINKIVHFDRLCFILTGLPTNHREYNNK